MVTCTTDLRTIGLDSAHEGLTSQVFCQTAGTFWFLGIIMYIPSIHFVMPHFWVFKGHSFVYVQCGAIFSLVAIPCWGPLFPYAHHRPVSHHLSHPSIIWVVDVE